MAPKHRQSDVSRGQLPVAQPFESLHSVFNTVAKPAGPTEEIVVRARPQSSCSHQSRPDGPEKRAPSADGILGLFKVTFTYRHRSKLLAIVLPHKS